ncbi:MAG: hypothetical protein GXZ14_08355 [Ruminococcaceae bacterium]|nr:hypothetical protein [Oscillospiraceae bacterium]
MVYTNTKTGASFETECEISGGDWQADKPKPTAKAKAKVPEKSDEKEE